MDVGNAETSEKVTITQATLSVLLFAMKALNLKEAQSLILIATAKAASANGYHLSTTRNVCPKSVKILVQLVPRFQRKEQRGSGIAQLKFSSIEVLAHLLVRKAWWFRV